MKKFTANALATGLLILCRMKGAKIGSRSYTPHMDLEYFAEQIGEELVEEYDDIGAAISVVYAPKNKHSKTSLVRTMTDLGVGPFEIESIDGYWKITN